MDKVYDVIVVGAGAAGIACAKHLNYEDKNFLLLEAQGRIGGRVRSVYEPDLPIAIELGAEFIHGVPHDILDWLLRLHIPFYDVRDEHLMLTKGKLAPRKHFWETIEKNIKKIKPNTPDRSVADFIKSLKSVDGKTKQAFGAYVEGFHAADLNLMGIQALRLASETDGELLNESQLFRPLVRYDQLLQRILDSFIKDHQLHLRTRITHIDWKKNNVVLTAECGPQKDIKRYRCKKLVLTVPIGVLKSPQIQWNKFPGAWEKGLNAVHMGHVQKLVLRFQNRFWEKITPLPTAFFHTGPDQQFPTWWSLQPLRTPHLVAWQGGPAALKMATLSDEERVRIALKTLALITGRSVSDLNSQIESWHTHNWSNDPHALGAYTFVNVDGISGARALSLPIEDTIYLAGEGIAQGDERGTVHGAFESGKKAAIRICE